MKKASQIILLIGGIAAIVAAVGMFIYAIFSAIIGGVAIMVLNGTFAAEDIPAWANEIIAKFQELYPNINGWEALAAFAMTLAILFFVFAILCIPAAILSFIARGKEKKGLYIACIILGIVSCTLIPAVGGVFGLIGSAQDPQPEEKPQE